MKTLKSLFTFFTLVTAFSVNAFGQEANVSASATIVDALTVTKVTDLNFGDILSTETPDINAIAANAGKVSIAGATGSQIINITITYPDSLVSETTPTGLAFGDYDVAYLADGTDDPSTADPLVGENPSGQTITGTYTAVTGVTAYIYVGGKITSAVNGVANTTYSADINVSVSYN